MNQQENSFQRHNSLGEGLNDINTTKNKQFSYVYDQLFRKFRKESSRVKFSPLIDVPKYKMEQLSKIKKITKNIQRNNSIQKIQILNLPSPLPKLREATKQQTKKIKAGKFQAEKFVVNETIYIHERKKFQKIQKAIQFQKTQSNSFRSILSQKSKKLKSFSRKMISQNLQNLSEERRQFCSSEINKKILNPQRSKIQFNKNRLIQTILQVQEKKVKGRQEIKKLQLSQRNILNDPFAQQQMVGSSKHISEQAYFVKKKKSKLKSIQKIYSVKERQKTNFDLIKRKINWKNCIFPLIKIQKSIVTNIFRRYLRVPRIIAPNLGFYKFYIGEGNNSQLVKQFLKTRGYWIQVDSLSEKPHFVWAQLPSQQFYTQQTLIISSQKYQKTDRQQHKLQQILNFLKFHQTDYLKACLKLLPQEIAFNLISEITKKLKNGFRINSYSDLQKYSRSYLTSFQAKQMRNSIGIMIKKQNEEKQQIHFKSNDFQLQNHVKRSHLIGNKKSLYKMFFQHCLQSNQNIDDFIPPTIHLTLNEFLSEQQIKIIISQNIHEGPWLVKPGQDTNRGNGIVFVQSHTAILNQIKKRSNQVNKNIKSQQNTLIQEKQRSLILQKYIEPLLYNGRKFDIRMWVLWSKNQLWWYKQGYLRTSSKQYSLKTTSKFVHLTNDAVQVNSQDYGKYEPANKLSFSEFQKYLDKQTLNSSSQQSNNGKKDFQNIYSQMKYLTKKLFTISKKQLFEDSLNFELFGLDFLVDKNKKVWLIQCNTNPSLQVHCSLQSRLVSNLIDNMLTIVVDPLFPCPQKRLSKQSSNNFWNPDQFKFQILLNGDQ